MDFELLGSAFLSAPKGSRSEPSQEDSPPDIGSAMPLIVLFCVLIGLGFVTALGGGDRRASTATMALAHLDLERKAAANGN